MATASFDFTQPSAESPNPDTTKSNFSVSSNPPTNNPHDNQKPSVRNNHKFIKKSTSLLSLKKKPSTQSFTAPPPVPVPELPPLEVNEHYQDLTHLFDGNTDFDSKPPIQTMNGLGINTSFGTGGKSDLASLPKMFSSQGYPIPQNEEIHAAAASRHGESTVKSISNSAQYDYEYYDLDNNDDDTNSIQASPVDIAPRLHTVDPAFRNTSGMTGTTASSQTNYSTHDYQGNMSPVSQQNSAFSHQPSSPSSNTRSPPTSINKNKFIPLSHSASQERNNQNVSAVTKVRNMFPGFGLYKALNKSSSNQQDDHASSSPYSFTNESALSFVEDDPAESALVANHAGARQHNTREEPLPFQAKKPTPHFTEIDLGPTYRAQVVPIRNNSKKTTSSAASSPQLANNSPGVERFDEEHDNLLHARQKSEVLDFVPNLRPAIDNVGSRLRTAGVPSPATLMMTKSQYDKYRQTEKSGNKNSDDEDGEEEEEDEDDDDDSDDEHGNHSRRVLEEDEAKKQDFRMRMKQDAHLSVYRQKMTKLTGSQIGLSNINPSPFQSNAFPSLDSMDYDSDEDYDDVPLGILKAHGFPTSGRLKTMRSQPNLNEDNSFLQPPGLYGGNGRPSGDTMSLRSFQSAGAGRPVTPAAPEEGYLAMRNLSSNNLPGFNSNVPMNRGLIGEIAKEQEAKVRRKSMMNNFVAQRTATLTNGSMMEGNDNGSLYNAPAPQPPNELQAQLQQMMQMQTQILHQMASNSAQSSPMTMMSTSGMMTPVNFQNAPMKKNWSSFDVMSSQQLMPSRGGAPSIRSMAQSEHSMRSYAGQQPRYKAAHQPHNSMHSLDMGGQQGSNGFKFPNRQPTPQQQAPPAPVMRLVNVDDEDDDDDDDEAGWKEMEARRQQLRQMWESQPAMVS